MTKEPQPDAGTASPSGRSIGSNGLTSYGQTELLKRIGDQLRVDYAQIVNEPLPVGLDVLAQRLRKLNKPKGQGR